MINEPIITMILPENIENVWHEVTPLLEPALSLSLTHNIDDVHEALISGKAQLWVQWSDKVDAAVITEFINYPRGMWCRFWLAGAAKDANILWKNFFEILYAFAKKAGCIGIEDCGRSGWNKFAPQAFKIATLRRILIGV